MYLPGIIAGVISSDIEIEYETGGTHTLYAHFCGQKVEIVRVRPVGTLESGELLRSGTWSPDWVPKVTEVLWLAKTIADREHPYERWECPDHGL